MSYKKNVIKPGPVGQKICFAVLLIVLVLALCFYITADQDDYQKYHKIVKNESAISAVITDTYSWGSLFNKEIWYAAIECNYNGATESGQVILAFNDYIGKTIQVKRLPQGGYIRSSYVISRHFILWTRPFTGAIVIAITIWIFGLIRDKFFW